MADDKSAREKYRPSARGAAVQLLNAVLGEGRMLAQIETAVELSGADRARAERLATETLRNLDRADKILKPLLRKSPPLGVLNVLRLAVVELGQGGAAHGVVNDAVTMVRQNRKTQHLSGLVNAVLRGVPQDINLAEMPTPMMPRWLRQPMVHAYGRDAVQEIETVQSKSPPIDITTKSGKAAPDGDILPTGSARLHGSVQISALPGFSEGDWWVQDAAASMAVRVLSPKPGEEVLDLCAAPGGKTMQLADAGAKVTAVDISETRMQRVTENLKRTGLTAEVIVADALHWLPPKKFDAILLDAPCSATGTIRRHPDLPYIKDGSEVAGLVELQARLFDRALGWLKPGGRIVFCTCSLLPEEGEGQLDAVLARHPDLEVIRPDCAGLEVDWFTARGGLRLRPDYWAAEGGMDGFFIAALRRA